MEKNGGKSSKCIMHKGIDKGILYGASAYLMWGFFPIYFKLLHEVPAVQILGHRVVWSLLFLLVLVIGLREGRSLRRSSSNRRTLLIYLLAAVLLATNWLTYIWGVNAGYVVETSLGYFINPLMNVILGVIILRERLRPAQWVPVGLAAAGVIYLTILYGTLPWIALALAFTFASYGLVKKLAPLGALHSLTIETGLLFVPALGFLLWMAMMSKGAFIRQGPAITILLALAGVITAVPLLLFGAAARRVPLSTLGILQFIAPTCQLLLGVFVYGEAFTLARLVGFLCIWLALLLYVGEGLITQRRQTALDKARPSTAAECT
jgi:chloramphenicol-sensitive protein RarD